MIYCAYGHKSKSAVCRSLAISSEDLSGGNLIIRDQYPPYVQDHHSSLPLSPQMPWGQTLISHMPQHVSSCLPKPAVQVFKVHADSLPAVHGNRAPLAVPHYPIHVQNPSALDDCAISTILVSAKSAVAWFETPETDVETRIRLSWNLIRGDKQQTM